MKRKQLIIYIVVTKFDMRWRSRNDNKNLNKLLQGQFIKIVVTEATLEFEGPIHHTKRMESLTKNSLLKSQLQISCILRIKQEFELIHNVTDKTWESEKSVPFSDAIENLLELSSPNKCVQVTRAANPCKNVEHF